MTHWITFFKKKKNSFTEFIENTKLTEAIYVACDKKNNDFIDKKLTFL